MRSDLPPRTSAISLFVCYVLVSLLCTPFATATKSRSVAKRASVQQQNVRYREGELLVRFRGGVSERDKDTILALHGAKERKQLRGESGVEKWELPSGRDAGMAALTLLLNPQVEFAEPNFLISKDDLSPNDPQFNEQWALRNTGQSGGQYGADINVNGAWPTTTAHWIQ